MKVVDTLPAGTTFLTATGTNWNCVHVSGTVTCNRTGGNLAVGPAPNITITVTAPATVPAGGTITNSAKVSSPNDASESTAIATTTVVSQGTVSGIKFNDMNADGDDEAGVDPKLTGWPITAIKDDGDNQLTATDPAGTTISTGAGGAYSFSLDPGSYFICEKAQPGGSLGALGTWFQSAPLAATGFSAECDDDAARGFAPNGYLLTVTSGSSTTGKGFGNYRQGTVSGTKFNDPNGDGILTDATVPAGPTAWTIRAYTDAPSPVLVTSTTTNATSGTYSLTLSPGNYIICEVLQSGWTQTFPANADCGTASGVSDAGHKVTITSGASVAPRNFGNFALDVEIDVEKHVSVDGGDTFVDADIASGPHLLDGFDDPQFKFIVSNAGNVALSGVSLTDPDFDFTECADAVPTSLAVGASFECILPLDWALGQHVNTATAEGSYTSSDGSSYPDDDTDAAYYFGANADLTVLKEVSVDGGTTWFDANAAPGPSLLDGFDAPRFRFTVKNTGNVALDVTLSDSVLTLPAGCDPGILAANNGAPGGADEFSCTVTGTWAVGQQSNTATASATFTDDADNEDTASDTDAAYYFGANADLTVLKEVSVDGGTTWFDANAAPGPSLLDGFDAPLFRFIVNNTGNVALDVTLSDSVLTLPAGCDPGTWPPTTARPAAPRVQLHRHRHVGRGPALEHRHRQCHLHRRRRQRPTPPPTPTPPTTSAPTPT